MSLDQAIKEAKDIRKYVLFEIVSNMLNDYLKGDQRIMDLYQAGLMSKERAVKATSPDLNNEQLKAEIGKLDEKEQAERETLQNSVEVLNGGGRDKDTTTGQESAQIANK